MRKAEKNKKMILEQVEWIQKCGGNLAGYMARYGTVNDPLGLDGAAIYAADMDYLNRLVEYGLGLRKDLFGSDLETWHKHMGRVLIVQ